MGIKMKTVLVETSGKVSFVVSTGAVGRRNTLQRK